MENTNVVYDILIVGGGPGGLSAALYAGRSEMKTLLLEEAFGRTNRHRAFCGKLSRFYRKPFRSKAH